MKKSRSLYWGLLLGLQLGTAGISADPGDEVCKDISGPFSSILVGGDACASPVGICTLGLLTGNFHATYEFTMQALEPDPEDPTVLIYSGTSVVTLRSGEKLYSIDTGVMHTGDPTATPFVTTATIVSGTGKHQSGQFVASGVLNFTTGEAVGSYTGDICKDKKKN